MHTFAEQNIMERKHTYNEIIIFLINLFFIEVIGRFLVALALFVCRMAGLEQIVQAYYSIPRHGYWVFLILLCVATIISTIRILRSPKH